MNCAVSRACCWARYCILNQLDIVEPGGIQVVPVEEIQVDAGIAAVGGGVPVVGVDNHAAELPVGDIRIIIIGVPACRGAAGIRRIVDHRRRNPEFPARDGVSLGPAAEGIDVPFLAGDIDILLDKLAFAQLPGDGYRL